MKSQDVLNFQNVKTKHFIFFTSQGLCWCGKAVLMTLARSSALAAPFPLKSVEGACSAQHPAVHQSGDAPQQKGGHTEPTSPVLACAQNLLSNKDDSLVTADAA